MKMVMRTVESVFKVMILLGVLVIAKSEIYIVTMEGEPVVSYKGGIDGFEATAVESDEKLDVTRLVNKFLSLLLIVILLAHERIRA